MKVQDWSYHTDATQETPHWLSALEPQHARAVMKRVVEKTTATDVQLELLYEEGV